jgi:NADH-quinone oxidoreductase subunit H
MNIQNAWIISWCDLIGFPREMPHWFYSICSLVCIYLFVILPSAVMMSYLDRKLTADLQARVGPNQAGPKGMLQPIADFLKLLQKEPRGYWNLKENMWLGIHTMTLYSTLAVLPLGSLALLVDTDMSAFLPFWASLVLALGTMLLGLSQASVPGWFGGIRMAAQALAGSFPALISLICAGLRAGSFKWSDLASSQGFLILNWTVFSNPFQFIAFFVFVMSGLVLLAIPPLDGGLSRSDIHGGVSSYLHGRRLSLFQFGRFYGFFFWSVITVVLFLGAWILPESIASPLRESESFILLSFLELVCLLSKTFLLMLLVIWVSRVNTRARVDQITIFAWKVLSPFSLVALIGASLWAGWRAI